MNKITIIKPGLLTTIQDQGRWGYQQFGMSVAGAMDHFSMDVANMILGNDRSEAVLECTYSGPSIHFHDKETICLTGADMQPKINGKAVPLWTSLAVEAGDQLTLETAQKGFRCYIAFSRGLDVPLIMGSRSTFLRGKLGGLHGEKLAVNDEIMLRDKEARSWGSFLPSPFIPEYPRHARLRVVPGPQDDAFTDQALTTFLSSSYTISSEADRMGYRLEGPPLEHRTSADIISDGIVFGSVQVPGHGMPIIMMSDRQTTGGYTKIATVITPDLNLLAQMGPGWSLSFEEITLDEAHRVYKAYQERLSEIETALRSRHFPLGNTRSYRLTLEGKAYTIDVDEIQK